MKRQPVWDLPLRVFHWALALLVAAQVGTALVGGNAMEYHALGGYAILALVIFRVAWGFVGGTHARFADFVRGPAQVVDYLRGRSGPFAGHSPLGGWSVVAMLSSLLVQAVTGLFANDDVMMEGPLARRVSDRFSEIATSIHDANGWLLVGLVSLHVLAVLFYLIVRRRNLILPMISGRKAGVPEPARGGGALRGGVLLAAAAAAVYLVVTS
jgi:cytochrome b